MSRKNRDDDTDPAGIELDDASIEHIRAGGKPFGDVETLLAMLRDTQQPTRN